MRPELCLLILFSCSHSYLRCNGEGWEDLCCLSQALVSVLGERVQHHHLLSLLDSLCEALLDPQAPGAEGVLQVLLGLATTRGSEVFQNIPGFVRKLHDKMELMVIDGETEGMRSGVASVVIQLAVHCTRGAVTALLHLEAAPSSPSSRLLWQGLASEPRLAGDVLEVLLETLDHGEGEEVTLLLLTGAQALTVMLESRRLEEVARLELARLFHSLVMLLAQAVVTSPSKAAPDPVLVCTDALRALFSCVNCVVVAASLPSSCPSLPSLTTLLSSLLSSLTTHAPHHLPTLLSPFTAHLEQQESRRVATLAVLLAATEAKAAGDPALLSSLVSCLLRSCSDPCPLARRLALQGVAGLASCSTVDIESYASQALSALLQGLDDDHCQEVSLTALQAVVALLPSLPAPQAAPFLPTFTLKVRPFFESSSEDHRAAAVAVYGALASFAVGDHREGFLEGAQGWLVPVLLHSSSPHPATSRACLATLKALVKVTKFPPLAEALAKHDGGLQELVSLLVAARCGALQEMWPTVVATGLSYFKSTNSLLRGGVVVLLGEVLEVCRGQEVGQEQVQEAIQGMLGLLRDPDVEVRKLAAATLGRVVAATMQPIV